MGTRGSRTETTVRKERYERQDREKKERYERQDRERKLQYQRQDRMMDKLTDIAMVFAKGRNA